MGMAAILYMDWMQRMGTCSGPRQVRNKCKTSTPGGMRVGKTSKWAPCHACKRPCVGVKTTTAPFWGRRQQGVQQIARRQHRAYHLLLGRTRGDKMGFLTQERERAPNTSGCVENKGGVVGTPQESCFPGMLECLNSRAAGRTRWHR